jgi:hypothetical protein
MTTLGGSTYAWDSPEIIGMGLVGVAALIALAFAERRASEPILPPALFGNRVFVVCSAVGLVVGFALFGALTYLPLFQQVVRGLSPTASGLQLLPVMGGVLISSIVSGQVITRTGRYKAFPIAGTGVAAIGMYLLSSLDEHTGTGVAAVHMLILGLGLGMVMQVLVLATQNAVSYEQLGVATSGATLFRSIGGSLGTAVLGAIFTSRLTAELGARVPSGAATSGANPSQIDQLPAPLHEAYVASFTAALDRVFLVATGIVVVAFLLTWLIQEKPLRPTVETSVAESLGAPVDTDSLREVTRGMMRVVGRERTLAFMAGTLERADVDLSPGGGWLLMRATAPDGMHPPPEADPDRFRAAVAELQERGYLADGSLTPEGRGVRDRLVVVRTDRLRELVRTWEPDVNPELDVLVRRVEEELERA